jgi:hypothetical protein
MRELPMADDHFFKIHLKLGGAFAASNLEPTITNAKLDKNEKDLKAQTSFMLLEKYSWDGKNINEIENKQIENFITKRPGFSLQKSAKIEEPLLKEDLDKLSYIVNRWNGIRLEELEKTGRYVPKPQRVLPAKTEAP